MAKFLSQTIDTKPPAPAAPRPWRTIDRLTNEEIAELVAQYQAGSTTRALADRFGLGKTAVVELLRQHGVTMRPIGRRPT